MTPNITSMRKEFTTTAYQQQSSYHHQQLLDHSTTATSPMKPKKRGSDSSKKPKKRRSSSASDKENDAQQQLQQQQQLQTTAETTSHSVTTNGYTNSNNTSDATSLANGTTTDSNSTHHSPSHNSSSLPASSTSASTSTQPQTPAVSVAAPTAVQTKVYDPHAMDFELEAAVELMTRFVSKTPAGKANLHKLGQFNTLLVQALREYYKGHWYPERPMRGSGHRCLRVNQSGSTSIIEKTALSSDNLWVLDSLPKEFTLWIDPGEVSYRIGEDGSICVHFNHPIKRPVSTKQG